MLVVDVTVAFFLCRPAERMILAAFVWALPRSLMCLKVLGQVARPFELLVAARHRTFMDLRLGAFLTASHGASDVIIIDIEHWSLHRSSDGRLIDLSASGETYSLTVLSVTNKLSWLTGVTHPTIK